MTGGSDGDRGLYGRPRVVTFEREILISEIEYILHIRIDQDPRKWSGLAAELKVKLL